MQTKMISEKGKLIAFIACLGSAAGKARFKGCHSCQEALELGFQRGECKDGCVGVGSCIASCPEGAMALLNGKVVIDREKCNGCGKCAEKTVCPQGLIQVIPADATTFIPCSSTEEDEEKVRTICGYGCISCGACEQNCPENAVHVTDNHAVIDYEKCVGCSACSVKCKKKIIVDVFHDLRALKPTVAFVKCAGDGRIHAELEKLGVLTCEEAATVDLNTKKLCPTGCFGCGSCVKVCRYDALHIVNGVAVVDSEKCVGCKDCTFACPKHLITILSYRGQKMIACSSGEDLFTQTQVCSTGCTNCLDCKANCPNEAIYIKGSHATIDPEYCEDCHICEYVCARPVIKALKVPEYIYAQQAAMGFEEGE